MPAQVSKVVSRSPWFPLVFWQEATRVDRTASLSSDDEGQVLPSVLVAILKAGSPHHDAVVQAACRRLHASCASS